MDIEVEGYPIFSNAESHIFMEVVDLGSARGKHQRVKSGFLCTRNLAYPKEGSEASNTQ